MDGECSDIRKELESWYLRDRGRYLLQSTRDALGPVLDTAFGYHILQLGLTRGQSLFENSPINHRIYACSAAGDAVTLLTCEDELPLESDSVDVVIAHHSLEFAANPHQVLRELQRVLTPQGHLLIVGFNPYSLHGLATRLRAFGGRSLWRQLRPVSENRLSDWLRLLAARHRRGATFTPFPRLARAACGIG